MFHSEVSKTFFANMSGFSSFIPLHLNIQIC
jgi:hypothetical protein